MLLLSLSVPTPPFYLPPFYSILIPSLHLYLTSSSLHYPNLLSVLVFRLIITIRVRHYCNIISVTVCMCVRVCQVCGAAPQCNRHNHRLQGKYSVFGQQNGGEERRAEQSRREERIAEESRAEESRGEQRRAEESRGEERRGEERRGEERRGEERGGEGRE